MPKIYTPSTWTDEVLAGPERYDIKTNAGAAIETNVQIDLATSVTTAGSSVDAAKMNNIEDGIDTLDTLLSGLLSAATELTISSDAITVTQSNHKLQPQTGTSDDLSTISGTTAGQSGVLYASDYGTDTITIKHNVGNILCLGDADISLSSGCVVWYSDGTKVFIAGGGSGGGGSFTYPSSALSAVARDDQIRIIKDVSAATDYYIELQNLLQFGSFASSYTFSSGGGSYNLTDALPYYVDVLPFANGDVNLPAKSAANHAYAIRNESGTYTLTVKLSGGTTIGTIAPGEIKIILPSASYDFKIATTGLIAANNLSDLASAATARTNLGMSANGSSLVTAADYAAMRTLLSLVIGTNVQAQDAELSAIAGLTSAANSFPYFTGSGTAGLLVIVSAIRTLLASADLTTFRTNAGLEIGVNVQAYDADLTTWAGKTAPSGTVVGTSDTQTVTNKRVQPRVYSTTSTATLTPEIDTYDIFHLTAQAAGLTIANHSTSTPADGEQIKIRILDNGTARSISFGTNYVAKGGIALPTTTTLSKNMEMGFEWNANLSKWNLLALAQEA